MKPGANDPGVLPPIKDPLQEEPGALPPIPKGRTPKNAPPIGGDDGRDPIAALQEQMNSYKKQVAEMKELLREEQEKNAQLSKDIADAMAAKKKAEEKSKKEHDLAQVFEASLHELKSVGDANGARAKELEAKLAASNAPRRRHKSNSRRRRSASASLSSAGA